ncbi:hypothetical protein PIROE2DRAFT_19034 [Piromyces sp. E2]|nr:hypothetical protein PIROE2DRAFT_19034 [Piromyces sp. E2]|eukprot:OUM56379.1 hypothetical protein PIROE2DRAFT_19034 [Piromyces sp. E2]
MKPVPIGIEGEIVVGGYGVGRGYLNREELTNEKYIIDPFNSNGEMKRRMYRSGDIGKWTKDGEVECLGRIDFQVKIRGQRIELSEIENTITEMEQIEKSIVLSKRKENNEQYLVAYYISNSEEINGNQIRNYLKEKLPHYMIPNYFISIKEIPVTNNGKLDRRALPEPSVNDLIKEEYIAPETETEKTLCNIFSKIFRIDVKEIGKLSNFYDLGGDSLNGIKCTSIIRKLFKVSISIKDIINHPLLAELATFIDNKVENNISKNLGEIIQKNSSIEYPVENIFGVVTTDNGNINFDAFNKLTNNITIFYKLNVPISIEKLTAMMNIIIERHNALRTVFFEKTVNGKQKLYGRVLENAKIEIEQYDVTNFYKFCRPFDVSKDLLIRVGLIDETILMVDMSHDISDGYSFSVLFKELYQLYYGEPLDDLPIQINDYYNHCFNNNKVVNGKALEFFRSMFNEEFEIVNVPKKPIEEQPKYDSNIVGIEKVHNLNQYEMIVVNTDSETFENINRVIRKYNLSKSAFFFAVYSFILAVYSGQRNIYNHIVIANRMNDDISKLIGLLLNIVPVLIKIENMTFIEYIKQVTNLLMTLINFHVPYEIVSDELNLPLYNSLFKFDPYELITDDESSSFAEIIAEDEIYKFFGREDLIATNMKPKADNKFYHDFLLEIAENKDSYTLQYIYRSSVFDKKPMEEMMSSFISLIKNEDYLNESVDKLLMDSNKFLDRIEPITDFMFIKFYNEIEIMEYEQNLLKASNENSVLNEDQDNNKTLIENSKLKEEKQSNNINEQDNSKTLIINSKLEENKSVYYNEQENNKILIENSINSINQPIIEQANNEISIENSIQEENQSKNKDKKNKKSKKNKVKSIITKIIKSIKKNFKKNSKNKNDAKKTK